MDDWCPKGRDLKRYPHFDKFLPPEEITRIVTDPERVRANPFFPFMRYVKRWQPFRDGGKVSKKERPIRYASRRDAYIFAYYRHILSGEYEQTLVKLGIDNCPIAYRRIPVGDGTGRGKCNIHFAKDVFDRIAELGNCCAVVLDISSYFEKIDHDRLRDIWCRLLDVDELQPHHAAVFKAITKYAVVDREKVYERLGYFGQKKKGEEQIKGFLKPFGKMPMQLCSPKEFREKICGHSPEYESLVEVNDRPYGIPQGAPISDLLANMYLIDFDLSLVRYVSDKGGYCYRYSDDIIILLPGDETVGREAKSFASNLIKQFGDQLVIKDEKTSIVKYRMVDGQQEYEFVEGAQGKNGLEYLGFRFDGKRIYLRDSTVSRFYRKITFSLRHETSALVARYPGKDHAFLVSHFSLERFIQRFGRVEEFDENADYRSWTFWTYARRAAAIFGERGSPILGQLRKHRRLVHQRVERELAAALSRKIRRELSRSS